MDYNFTLHKYSWDLNANMYKLSHTFTSEWRDLAICNNTLYGMKRQNDTNVGEQVWKIDKDSLEQCVVLHTKGNRTDWMEYRAVFVTANDTTLCVAELNKNNKTFFISWGIFDANFVPGPINFNFPWENYYNGPYSPSVFTYICRVSRGD